MPEHPNDAVPLPDEAAGQPDEPAAAAPSAANGEAAFAPEDASPGDAPPAAPVDASAQHGKWRARLHRMVTSRAVWAALAAGLAGGGLAWHRCGLAGCPSVARLASYQPGGASVLLDRDGAVIGDLAPVRRQMIPLERLPAHVAEAFIAVEDKRFHSHRGVDWRRVAGAALANLRAGRTVQGSSTITMQLARNVFQDRIRANERTLRRKLLEVRVAREIERRFAKDDILEMYLNHIYFGAGAYGIEAASHQYFGRSAADLTLEQAALLAALPKAPSHYDPRRFAKRARERRDLVVALMLAQDRISTSQASRASASALRVRAASNNASAQRATAPWFVAHVRALLEDRLGEDVYARRLRIHTTLDRRLQLATEEELERQIRAVEQGAFGPPAGPAMSRHDVTATQTRYLQGAAVLLDASTGDVLALVGGRNAAHSSFNRAVAARRQVGSAFKPFVFAAALRRGWSPAAVLDDSPFRLVSGRQTWEPANFDGAFVGPVTLREALVHSRNVPTVRLVEDVGVGHVAKLARDAGLRGEIRDAPVIALGVTESSPLELAAAYSAFAGQGDAVTPRFIVRVEDENGDVLWAPDVERRTVMDPGVAYIMTDMMGDAVDRGTGRAVRSAGYHGRAAGKTGTTNEGADVWFVGYTPRMVGSVWIGFDQPHAIAPRATGGSVAAPVWGRIARRAGRWAGGEWNTPDQVVRLAIDPTSGLALEQGCIPRHGDATEELFVRGSEPRLTCPARVGGRSWLGRAIAWIGDLFESEERPAAEPRRYAEGNERGDRLQRPRGASEEPSRVRERRAPLPVEPGWRDGQDWRGLPRDRADWIEELIDDVADDLPDREAALLDWVEDLADRLEDAGLSERDGRRMREWADRMRSSSEARQEAREDAVRRMLERLADQLQDRRIAVR